MECFAKIIQEQKSENRLFWKYTFFDIQNSKEDCFLSDYQINYFPDLAGKLKVLEDNNQQTKIFQSFNQTDSTAKEFQLIESLVPLEREWKQGIKEAENNFAKKRTQIKNLWR